MYKKFLASTLLVAATPIGAVDWFSLGSKKADRQYTAEQLEELYEHGTITVYRADGSKRGHWELLTLPGAKSIRDISKEQWRYAFESFSGLARSDYWVNDFVGGIASGWDIAERGYSIGVSYIPVRWNYALSVQANIDQNNWDSLLHSSWNWSKFGVAAFIDSLWSLGFGGVGALTALYLPAFHLFRRSIGATMVAFYGGTLMPSMSFAWNYLFWYLLSSEDIPDRETLLVRWVPASSDKCDL